MKCMQDETRGFSGVGIDLCGIVTAPFREFQAGEGGAEEQIKMAPLFGLGKGGRNSSSGGPAPGNCGKPREKAALF